MTTRFDLIGHSGAGKSSCLKHLGFDSDFADMDEAVGTQREPPNKENAVKPHHALGFIADTIKSSHIQRKKIIPMMTKYCPKPSPTNSLNGSLSSTPRLPGNWSSTTLTRLPGGLISANSATTWSASVAAILPFKV